ncbi:MAG: hypothetical protein ACE5JU_22285 [Candidatus Binatia bacterium]
MALMRGYARMDGEGRIAIPSNIRREVGLQPDQVLEIKVTGPRNHVSNAQYMVISKTRIRRSNSTGIPLTAR